MEVFILQPFLIALAVGTASGAVGAFVVLRRMALVGDALSHVALPGIALALVYHIDPFWGVLGFLLAAALLIWRLEQKTTLPVEALVGLLFTASLAVGVLVIPDYEIIESLFGAFPEFGRFAFVFFLLWTCLLTFLTFIFARSFIFSVVSGDLARLRDRRRLFDLFFFLVFSATVALGIKLIGTLLMGALTIIPASVAKNMARSMQGYIVWSAILGAGIAGTGVLIASALHLVHPGPPIILFGVALFLVSFIRVRK